MPTSAPGLPLAPAYICIYLCPHLRRGLRRIPARNCAKCVRVCVCVCARASVCTRVCVCMCECACVSSVFVSVLFSVCARARVCWSLRCRRIARRNIPGCMLHDGPFTRRERCGFVLRCRHHAVLHAVNGFSGGGPRSNPYRVSKGKLAAITGIARAARRGVGRCCARPTSTRPGPRRSVLAAGGRQWR